MEFEQLLKIVKAPAFGETRMKIDVLAGQLAAAVQPADQAAATEPSTQQEEAKVEEINTYQVPADDLD